MKKIVSLLLTLVLVVALVGCNNAEKKDPQLTNGNEILSSITENNIKYSVTNQEIYNALKGQYGSTILINIVDTKLLKELKNSDGKDYYSAVTDEEIKSEIDSVMYGDEELTDEEKQEKKEEFLENLFIGSGINTTDPYANEVLEKYRLTLAEKAYAKDCLAKEVAENDKLYKEYKALSEEEQEKKLEDEPETPTDYYFSDTKVSTKYSNDVYSTYRAIVVPFTSVRQAEMALQQINVTVKDGVWTDGDTALSANSVLEKFIELYKLVYGYKGLDEINTESDEFYFKEGELNTNVLNQLKENMEIYTNDSSNSNPKWYTPKAFEIGSGNEAVYILKLEEVLKTSYSDLTDEEKEAQRTKYNDALIEDALTSNYIQAKMANLRNDKNLVIYDSVVEGLYYTSVSKLSVEFEKTSEESTQYVASLDGINITPNELFEELLKYQGASIVVDKLVEKRCLYNTNLNKYYDMNTNKWLDDDKEEEIEDLIEAEKKNFKNGNYKDYGYDPSLMNWNLFIKSLYSVESEDELVLAFLAESINDEYAESINKFTEMKDNDFVLSNEEAIADNYWRLISNQMDAAAKEKFSVEGIHLLVCHYETIEDYLSESNIVDPEEWTEEQKEAANNLVNEVIAFVKDSKGTYESRLERIADAFKYAPVKDSSVTYNGKEVSRTITSDNGNVTIHLSEYKEKGLFVKYESLGVFTQGKMVDSFNDAVKAIWDKDAANDTFNDSKLNSVSKVTVLEKAIVTKYGYHAYINLESKELSAYIKVETITTDDKTTHTYKYVPTSEEVRTYVKNNDTTEITDKVKTAIKTYYNPIAEELSGDEFTYAMMINALNQNISSYTSNINSVSKDVISKYIEVYMNYTFDELLEEVTRDYLYVK